MDFSGVPGVLLRAHGQLLTLKHLGELKLHHPYLTELQNFTCLREVKNASGYGFSHMDLGIHQMMKGLTRVGVGLSFVCFVIIVFFVNFYCCRTQQPAYAHAPAPVSYSQSSSAMPSLWAQLRTSPAIVNGILWGSCTSPASVALTD